jgi:gamma-glutamyltranspeptidase/glutathione hydrolase
MPPHVAVAAPTRLAAEAGARVAAEGGNAVDAAVAGALVAMISEPGICALGAGGFITVERTGEQAETIDGNVAMPGLGLDPSRFGARSRVADMEYGGGVVTTVGYESVAVPGGVAALGAAIRRHGDLPWAAVVAPAIEVAASGFPLSSAAAFYLTYSHEQVFGWDPASRRAIHRDNGEPKQAGDHVEVEGLAETLETLASEGATAMYTGSLADVIVADFAANGGLLTAKDLSSYTPTSRPCVETRLGRWTVSTNPPPSVGGPMLLAMLELARHAPADPSAIASAQQAAMAYRRDRLDLAEDLTDATRRLMDDLAAGQLQAWMGSPSTVHVSTADRDGNGCAITMSSGYGSGVIPAGTGMWMNNSLGEAELNRRGYHQLVPGARLPSNMAPTVAVRDDGAVLAIGSPGADRITTALQQVLLAFAARELTLQEAVDAPRLHVELEEGSARVAHEPGAEVTEVGLPDRPFDRLDMFFGGVTATEWSSEGGLIAAADPRRTGGTAMG